jgi:hypothetical protein
MELSRCKSIDVGGQPDANLIVGSLALSQDE